MKTKRINFLLFAIIPLLCLGATVIKISQFPNTATLSNTDLFIVASGSTNKNVSWLQLQSAIGTNKPGAAGQVLTSQGTNGAPYWGTASGGGDQVWTNAGNGVSLIGSPVGISYHSDLSLGQTNRLLFSTSLSTSPSFEGYAQVDINPTFLGKPVAYIFMDAQNTNLDEVTLELSCDSEIVGNYLIYGQTNGTGIFGLNDSGVVKANGFTDILGNSPPQVGGLTISITVVTNGTDTATLIFTNGILMRLTAP